MILLDGAGKFVSSIGCSVHRAGCHRFVVSVILEKSTRSPLNLIGASPHFCAGIKILRGCTLRATKLRTRNCMSRKHRRRRPLHRMLIFAALALLVGVVAGVVALTHSAS